MDIFLGALKKSVEHLEVIDDVLSKENYPEKTQYLEIKNQLITLNKQNPDLIFTDLLYVGGKKGRNKGYQRQMILNDVIEYIYFGRGYYYMEGDKTSKKIFIEIILQTINILMIMDSLTVNYEIRKKILEELEGKLGSSFFKDIDMKLLHDALKKYKGPIGFDTQEEDLPKDIQSIIDKIESTRDKRSQLDDYYDSILPKTGGGLWNELIVFFYLLRRTSVYILPLLLIQRIFSKNDMLKPPDYIVIDKQKRFFGIEVGGGKETQSGNFASKTGATMVTTQNTNIPPRCPICGKWILFCPKVIKDCCDLEKNPLLRIKKEVRCTSECDLFSSEDVVEGKCPYTQYHGKVSEITKQASKQKIKFQSEYHYHYSCIKDIKDEVAQEKIKQQTERAKDAKDWSKITVLKTDYPYVSGIDVLEKLDKNEIVCYGKYPNYDKKNCENCDFQNDCEKLTKLLEFSTKAQLSSNEELELKRLLA